MKKSGREKRVEISLALFMFWCFAGLFQLLTAFSEGMSTKCLTLLPFIFLPIFFPFFLFSLCVSFVISSLSPLFFFLFYATLFYYFLYIFLHVCFTRSFSCLFIAFHCFSFPVPFSFSLLFVSFVTLKHRHSNKKQCLHPFFAQKD